MRSSLRAAALALPLALMCAAPAAAAPELEPVGSFAAPTYVTFPPGDARLFVTERAGTVRIVGEAGAVKPEPFLDITAHTTTVGERGLLSMAFPPDYTTSGLVYVFVTGREGSLRSASSAARRATPTAPSPAPAGSCSSRTTRSSAITMAARCSSGRTAPLRRHR